MAGYRVVFKRSVRKDMAGIPSRELKRIMSRIAALSENPRPPQSIRLSGDEKYRIRQGRYRILYAVEDAVLTVTVVRVGHRRDVYRKKP